MRAELIAPCGMNCNLCSSFLAFSTGLPRKRGKISHCKGCLPRDKKCAYLKGQCEMIRKRKIRFCFECKSFPCRRLKAIDARYRKTYSTSLIGNLMEIKAKGVASFLDAQEKAFACRNCGGVRSIHNGKCYKCDTITSWKA